MLHLVFGVQFELLMWDPLDRKPTALLPQVGGPAALMFLPGILQRNKSQTFLGIPDMKWAGSQALLCTTSSLSLPCKFCPDSLHKEHWN